MSLQRQLEEIEDAYCASVLENPLEDDFCDCLAEGHSENAEWTRDTTDTMILAIDMRALQIAKMTSKLPQFHAICQEDRLLLHHYNKDLYKMYILAKCFRSWNGNERLRLLCDGRQVERPQLQRLVTVNQWGDIMPANIETYIFIWRCFSIIQREHQYPVSFNAVIGYYIILSTQHWPQAQLRQLTDLEKVKELHSSAEQVFLYAWNTYCTSLSNTGGQLDSFIKTLYSMVCTSTGNFSSSMVKSAVICTTEENQWIRESMHKMNQAFQSVQYDEMLIQDLIEISLGDFTHYERYTLRYGPNAKSRLERILSGFGERQLNMANFQTLVLLQIMKGSSFPNLDEQMSFLLGLSDHGLAVSDMPAASFYTVLCQQGAFDQQQRAHRQLLKAWGQLVVFLKDDVICHLIMMTILLDMPSTQNEMNRYQGCLLKKLNAFSDDAGYESGHQAYHSFFSNFHKVIRLMGMLQHEVQEKLQKTCNFDEQQ